jgi:small-conductance mechanosensitive channel
MGRVVDEWAVDAQEFVRVKLPHLLVVAVIAFVLMRLLHLVTYSMTRAAERHSPRPRTSPRSRRWPGIVRTTGLAIIWLIAGLQILDALGVNLAPLLASAGIAGIALGLAAQNIVKDVLNGILILDRRPVQRGGYGAAGRPGRNRGGDDAAQDHGARRRRHLYIVPNSQITTVANLSVGYSVATVNVSVDFSANPDQVLELLKGIAMEIRNSEEFREVFVADPQILGVDAIKGSELIFPVVFKTLATKAVRAGAGVSPACAAGAGGASSAARRP